jgi:hypothetical protein
MSEPEMTTSLSQSIDTQVCAEITKAVENNKETIKNKILEVVDTGFKTTIDDKLNELENKLLEKSKTLFDAIFQKVQNNILSSDESINQMEQNIQKITNHVIQTTLGDAVKTTVETIIQDNNKNLRDVCQGIPPPKMSGGNRYNRTKKSYKRSRKTRKGRN